MAASMEQSKTAPKREFETEFKVDPNDPVSKYYAKAATQKFDEYPKWPSSYTGGVIPMLLRGRFDNERERLGPDFTDKDRQWRIKYIKAQELHPSEPFQVKQLYYEYNNIFRRIMKYPMNQFEKLWIPILGKRRAFIMRRSVANALIFYVSLCSFYYYIKYNRAAWESGDRGWLVGVTREPIYPGEKGYPQRQQSWEHYDLKFHQRNCFLGDYTTSTPRYANGQS